MGGLALVSVATGAADGVSDAIASQARYWESRGRPDLARESWLKLLRVDPSNAEALAALAMGAPQAPVRDTPPAPSAPKPAATDPVPVEPITPRAETWERAREALERQVRENPGQLDHRLALARHLTLRIHTRWAGLDQVMQLAQYPAVAAEAQAVWRQALLWMSGGGPGARYFEAYLQQFGEDDTIRGRLRSAAADGGAEPESEPSAVAGTAPESEPAVTRARVATRSTEMRRAQALLASGELEAAEEAFAGLRARNPQDAEAIGGLGSVLLQQERFAEAHVLLEEATRLAPERWRATLARALIGRELGVAAQELAQGRSAESERRMRELLRESPQIAGKDARVKVLLADALAAQQNALEAERIYRDVLRPDRDHEGASRGLIRLLSNTERGDEAMAFYRTLGVDQQARIGGLPALQAQALRQQATAALAAKDVVRAESLLREALVIDPLGIWARLDLARLYLSQDRRREARSLIEGLPAEGPRRGETAYVRALIAAEEQHWFDALIWMEKVPAAERSAEMAVDQARMWVLYQTERAAVYARQGYRSKALALLGEIEPHAGTPALLGRLASAYSEAGDAARALQLLRQEIARKPDPTVELQLHYARLLLALDQQVEFEALVDQLARRSYLSPAERGELAELRLAHRLRRAERLVAASDLVGAHALLESALREHPEHPPLLAAIGGLYEASREYERAASLYQQALDRDPGLVAAYQGAIRSALARDRKGDAERWLAEAMRVEPESSELYELAAQLAKAQGQTRRAKELARRARELQPVSSTATANQGSLRLQRLDAQLRPIGTSGAAETDEAGDTDASSDEAEQARFERRLRDNPFDPAALNNLGVLAAARARYGEAQDLLERAQRLAPDSAEIRQNLEQLARWQLGEPDAAAVVPRRSKLPPEPPAHWSAASNAR